MKEDLRKSLDTMLMFEKLIGTFRMVVKRELEDNQDINDELMVTMVITHSGLGSILVELDKVAEIIQNRMSWYGEGGEEAKGGDGIGFNKKLLPNFFNDGEEDFGDTYDFPKDEEEDFKDYWNEEDEYDPNEPND